MSRIILISPRRNRISIEELPAAAFAHCCKKEDA